MASYEDTKREMMANYPSLFVDEADVLEQLFFINGNGYRWKDGELVDPFKRDLPIRKIKKPNEVIDSLKETDPERYKALVCFKCDFEDLVESDDPEVEREKERKYRLKRAKEGSDCYILKSNDEVQKVIYPLCEYADILNVPDDVKPDWLEAARKALKAAKSFKLTKKDKQWLKIAETKLERFNNVNEKTKEKSPSKKKVRRKG